MNRNGALGGGGAELAHYILLHWTPNTASYIQDLHPWLDTELSAKIVLIAAETVIQGLPRSSRCKMKHGPPSEHVEIGGNVLL